jgi:ABC-type glycerol-3-phosphate transport system permease component
MAAKPETKLSAHPVLTAVAVFSGAVFVLPALWILVGSFRPNADIVDTMSSFSWDVLVPSHVTFDNYTGLIADHGFGRAFINSLIVCVASVVLGLVISATASYALTVYSFPG